MWVADSVVAHLREAIDLPDLTGTSYRMIRPLGRGGMGVVYLVHDERLGRDVALKILGVPDPDGALAARLLLESRVLARLEHPNIVPIYDVGSLPDNRVFYAMKLVRGERLDDWMRSHRSRPCRLRLFLKVCEAVAFAHANGVIHRDLKPHNIMVGAFGEALVMDWGLAKLVHPGGRPSPAVDGLRLEASENLAPAPALPPHAADTHQGALIGTPGYMAPEQVRGQVEAQGERSDVYALGAVLWYLLAGKPPFGDAAGTSALGRIVAEAPPSVHASDRSVPRALDAICSRAMATQASLRYATAEDLAADVARHLDGQPVTAHRETAVERLTRLARRHRAMILLVAAYLLMRLVLFFVASR